MCTTDRYFEEYPSRDVNCIAVFGYLEMSNSVSSCRVYKSTDYVSFITVEGKYPPIYYHLCCINSVKASILYQKAIGILEFGLAFLTEAELVAIETKTDIYPSVLEGFTEFVKAESQVISILLAVEKGNSPSLVSGLACSCSQKYERASYVLDRRGDVNYAGSYLDKLVANSVYKSACFESLMLAYAAQIQLDSQQGGSAVKLATDAQEVLKRAVSLGQIYDVTEPKTGTNECEIFESSLKQIVDKMQKQADSDNRHVYFQPLPSQRPPLPPAQEGAKAIPFELSRLVSIDSAIFDDLRKAEELPQSLITVVDHPSVQGATSNNEEQSDQETSWWFEWLGKSFWFLLIFVVTSLLGLLLTILLFPFHLIYGLVQMITHGFWSVVKYFDRAPTGPTAQNGDNS
eukprot:g1506.t1